MPAGIARELRAAGRDELLLERWRAGYAAMAEEVMALGVPQE